MTTTQQHADSIQEIASLPNWSESLVIQVHDPGTGMAVWAHFSRMPVAPEIWEGDLVVFDEDDTLLVSRTFSRSTRGDEAGGILRMRCLERGQRWSLAFDSMATRVTSAQSLAAPVGDGDVEHVTVDLLFEGIHPLWSPGGVMHSQSWGSGHVEQAGRITGQVVINGRTHSIDGHGFRDHSYGPRDYAKMIGDTWANGVFPDGTVLLALAVWADPTGSAPVRLGFFWDGQSMHELEDTNLKMLSSLDGQPDRTRFTARYSTGAIEVDVELTHRMGFTLQTPVGMSLGATPSRSDLALVVESPVILRRGDQTAYGWYEQSRRRSELPG